MKKLYLVLFTLFVSSIYAQRDSGKQLIVFHSQEDLLANTGEEYGIIWGSSNSSWGKNIIFVKKTPDSELIPIDLNKFWGFKIGEYIFRMNKYSLRIPMLIVKNEDKVFYLDGYLFLYRALYNDQDDSSFRSSDGCFYSDDLSSEVYEITKMIKKEKDNPQYKEMIECIKESKKRLGVQSQFNGYVKCIGV